MSAADSTGAADAPDFRLLFEAGPRCCLLLSSSFRVLAVSDAYLNTTQMDREEILGQDFFSLFAVRPSDPTASEIIGLRRTLGQVLSGRRALHRPLQEYYIRPPNTGADRIVVCCWRTLSVPILDATGEVRYILYSVEDAVLLPHKDKLADGEFRALLESAPDAMVIVDKAGQIVLINAQTQQLFGYDRTELIGQKVEILIPSRYHAQHPGHRAHYGHDPKVRAMGSGLELYGRRKDGSEFPVEISLSPIHTEQGVWVASAIRDITETKRAQQALANLNRLLGEQNQELARASRAKTDFLAMMSHELRTPLNSVIGFSEVLLDQKFGTINDRQKRYLSNVNESGKHLLRLINDLLDLSKIEAGRLELTCQMCATNELVVEAVATLRPLIEARGLIMLIEPDEVIPAVMADPMRLKQVLYNLLSNAIKFSPQGGTIRILWSGPNVYGMLRIAVRDQGPGISSVDQQRLFKPFTQLDRSQQQGGTGLGLSLTKNFVELMGGEIGVTSELGQGATFFIELPVRSTLSGSRPARREGQGRTTALNTAPLALVVDDDPDALELLRLNLQSAGYHTICATSGEEALIQARACLPRVIILDVFLKGIDGWDVLRALKGDPLTAPIPVVMATISGDREKALSLGAVEHLQKPVERPHLISVLRRHALSPEEGQRSVHILVVDDDPGYQELIRIELEPAGFRVTAVSTGKAGIEAALSGSVDVMLLDLGLPDLSGLSVVATLRKDPRTRELPILIVTGQDRSKAKPRLHTGVSAVLNKSDLQMIDLPSVIEQILKI